jgi:hypothetical protein
MCQNSIRFIFEKSGCGLCVQGGHVQVVSGFPQETRTFQGFMEESIMNGYLLRFRQIKTKQEESLDHTMLIGSRPGS